MTYSNVSWPETSLTSLKTLLSYNYAFSFTQFRHSCATFTNA